MAMASKLTSSFLTALACATTACKPGVGQPAYLVTDYALLAVRGEPAEARPGANVTYEFLLASPSGTVASAQAEWEICQTPKPPSEGNAVSSACTGAPDAGAGAADPGQPFAAPIPSKACQLFGPIAPPPVAGQPAVRPRDPDGTGGYYLPVHLWLPNLPSGALSGFALERIFCNLANAPSDAIADYNSRYQPNIDPVIDHTDLIDAGGNRLSLDAGPQPVAASTAITLEATFGAGSAETFPVFNQATQKVEDQQESLSLSWFVTGGSFDHDRTGVAAGDPATTTSNGWTAPSDRVPVYLWLVLRDSRGGTTFKSYQMEVAP
jgi:hypothetical protein